MDETRGEAGAPDAIDPLARSRERLVSADPELFCLDGTSRGRLLLATVERPATLIRDGRRRELILGARLRARLS